MEMKLDNNRFWVLQTDEEITLYNVFRESVIRIKELMQENKETDEIDLMLVEIRGEKMTAKTVSWSEIAAQIVKL
ncbi:MAG: hypothetical protein QGH39_03785 [Candidatus Thermoplasmatota archaeon]|jgi:hypothetical protein|nr:hypothetical protein [Candidatus Thermoplasmatota archaeon]MDP7264661.1 hypothetical protein [Candidatus Thermoplasmatota archaeon]